MRLTTVTIAFIFFGTVFATPIYPLRGNPVALSKRAKDSTSTDTGTGEPPRGRGRGRGRGMGRGGTGTGASSSPKRKASSKSQSGSRKRAKCEPNPVSEAVFLEALRHINPKFAGRGSRALAVFPISEPVGGCQAVVKIISTHESRNLDAEDLAKIPEEVAGLAQVKQLLGWGTRKNPPLEYILMKHVGDPLVEMAEKGLTLANNKEFIERKQAAALELYRTELHLEHGDPTGHDNYLWTFHEDADETDMDARFTVDVVDWDEAKQVGPEGTQYAKAPTPYNVPDERAIYAPTDTPKSSDKASSSPASNSEDEAEKAEKERKKAAAAAASMHHTTGDGTRRSSRFKAKGKAKATGSDSEHE
ncbi:hypothetical protein F5887DRAFT_1212551 [Amanita rubescens]|nr:hypothetical protein F5887DRAFT_1212551 [Amanita rubescens]